MTIRNLVKERVTTTVSALDIAARMQALNIDKIPKENRATAIREALAMMMLGNTPDPAQRAKPAFQEAQKTFNQHGPKPRRKFPSLIIPGQDEYL